MDLNRPVIYRNLDVNDLNELMPAMPLSGFVINEARFHPVEGWGYREKRSLEDGYDVSEVYLGMRQLTMRGTIYAQTTADLHDRVRLVRALFTPTLAYGDNPNDKGFLPLYFDVPTHDATDWPGGYISLALYVRPRQQPSFFFVRETAFGSKETSGVGGYSIPYEADLEARDPLFYHPIAQTKSLVTPVPSGTVKNRGDYPARLVFELYMSAAAPGARTLHFDGAGTDMDVTIPGVAEDRLVRVDSYDKVVTYTADGKQSLRMDLVEFNGGKTWPKVEPGSSDFSTTITGGNLGTGSRMVWLETFV